MGEKEHLLALESGEFDLNPGSALLDNLLFSWNSGSMYEAIVTVILITIATTAVAKPQRSFSPTHDTVQF